MKALHIDFVPRTRWRAIWWLTAIGLAALVTAQWPTFRALRQNQRDLDQSIALLRKQTDAPATLQKTAIDPRIANTLQAVEWLQHDLNKVFTLLESIKEPNARLRNLSLDSAAGTVRLEYELDTIVRASSLTLVLNAGYAQAPWQLENISATATSTPPPNLSLNQSANPMATGQYRAQWSANRNKL
jgi:hypothetical protein